MSDQGLLDEIKAAYRSLRKRPMRGRFFIRRGQDVFACPLAALALNRGAMDGVSPGFEFVGGALDAGAIETVEWAARTFGQEWVDGFLNGFEGQPKQAIAPEYARGYTLGADLAQELLDT